MTTTISTTATFIFVLSDGTERTRTVQLDSLNRIASLQDYISEAMDWSKKPGRKAFWVSHYGRRMECTISLVEWVESHYAPDPIYAAEQGNPWSDPWANI